MLRPSLRISNSHLVFHSSLTSGCLSGIAFVFDHLRIANHVPVGSDYSHKHISSINTLWLLLISHSFLLVAKSCLCFSSLQQPLSVVVSMIVDHVGKLCCTIYYLRQHHHCELHRDHVFLIVSCLFSDCCLNVSQ